MELDDLRQGWGTICGVGVYWKFHMFSELKFPPQVTRPWLNVLKLYTCPKKQNKSNLNRIERYRYITEYKKKKNLLCVCVRALNRASLNNNKYTTKERLRPPLPRGSCSRHGWRIRVRCFRPNHNCYLLFSLRSCSSPLTVSDLSWPSSSTSTRSCPFSTVLSTSTQVH